MRLLIPGLLLYALFVLFGRWYFVCEVRNRCGEQEEIPARTTSLVLTEGENVVLEGYEQFFFPKDSIRPDLSSGNHQFLQDLTVYLEENPSKQLLITGFYLQEEALAPSGFFNDLGMARAAQIGLNLEDRGINARRITLHAMVLDRDTLLEPVRFLIRQATTSTIISE
ncbi:MAG: hypothetical protein IPL49_06995 [Saprospirales bacterium]|nr:hypothetical protein [Saprospirales bacterium]MBK8490637.1 hypothetical protein [Saprospirales bacterium]